MAEIYGLYKQGCIGDINIPQPYAFKVFERGKWEGWNAQKGMSQEQARIEYIDRVKELLGIESEPRIEIQEE